MIATFVATNIGLGGSHIPNQARLQLIGKHQTVNGSGTVTGTGRIAWSCGQACGPYAVLHVYQLSTWAPWALIAAVLALPLLLYPLRGVPLTRDPDWSSFAIAREGAEVGVELEAAEKDRAAAESATAN